MVKINFENLPSTNTPLSAENLNLLQNNVEDGISDNLIEAKDYTDTKGITESGSNANGNYIKYDDGTMICYNRVSQTKNIDIAYEGAYFGSIERVNFPQTFIDIPSVTVTMEQSSSLLTFNFSGVSATSFGGYMWKQQTKSNVSVYIHYIAIGKWK